MGRGLQRLLDLILLLVAGAAVAAAWVALAPVDVGGGSLGAVAGKSMEPTLHSGDLIVVRPGAYRVGEIVAYRSAGRLVVHRIVSIANGRLVLRGDANDDVDPMRPASGQVVGKVRLRVPGIGSAFAIVRGHAPAALVVAGLLVAVGLWRPARRGVDWLRCHVSASRPAPRGRSTSATR